MTVSAIDIPLIRLNWVSARALRREANFKIDRSENHSRAGLLEPGISDKAIACGTMLMMAKLRLQIRKEFHSDRTDGSHARKAASGESTGGLCSTAINCVCRSPSTAHA